MMLRVPSIGLRADFAIDAGAMGDGVAAADGLCEQAGVREIGVDHRGDGWVTEVASAGEEDRLVTEGKQVSGEVAADEIGAAGDGDFHCFLRFLARICVGQTALRKPFRTLARLSDSAW